jgi:lipopolysaccharide/colanic/teichoic acid biosynthesis glycosyltransferase
MWIFIQQLLALILLILSSPLWIILAVLIPLDSKGAFIFKQKRWGKGKKMFVLYKFRTMVEGAEKLKKRYLHLNETDGPVFKIRKDPRYTRVGKFLAHTGIDELPQLINILRGEMVFVGPRPLPIPEAKAVPKKYQIRFSVLPGITSLWVVKGAHDFSFSKWMQLDAYYIRNKSIFLDLTVMWQTLLLILSSAISQIIK